MAKRKAAKRTAAKKKLAVKPGATGRRRAVKPTFTVFITWSGDESRCLAKRLNWTLPIIVPKLKVIFSPSFTPGAAWTRKVQSAIQQADYVIMCVTKESLESRWMNFEAGASWKALKGTNICPLLLDVEKSGFDGPLSMFQARQFKREDVEDLCKYLAKKTRLGFERFKINFDGVWPGLRDDVSSDLKQLKAAGLNVQ